MPPISVKISIAGAPRLADISQYLGNSFGRLGEISFSVNDPTLTQADVWIVLESPDPDDRYCETKRVVYCAAESMWAPGHEAESDRRQRYLSQFDTVYTFQDLLWKNVRFEPPFLPWMINANHGASIFFPHERDVSYLQKLKTLDKAKPLSVICSTKTYTEGHRLRLRFVDALASELGEEMDWFGNGFREVHEKWEAIAPYRFHLVIENQCAYGVFTEKLLDAFLGLAHPIYYGAPDIENYFPKDSVTPINIRDFPASLEKIRERITGETDASRGTELLSARDRVLGQWNLFHRFADLATQEIREKPRTQATLLHMPPRNERSWRQVVSQLLSSARKLQN